MHIKCKSNPNQMGIWSAFDVHLAGIWLPIWFAFDGHLTGIWFDPAGKRPLPQMPVKCGSNANQMRIKYAISNPGGANGLAGMRARVRWVKHPDVQFHMEFKHPIKQLIRTRTIDSICQAHMHVSMQNAHAPSYECICMGDRISYTKPKVIPSVFTKEWHPSFVADNLSNLCPHCLCHVFFASVVICRHAVARNIPTSKQC